MKITIAQLNPVVGDIEGNLRKVSDTLSKFGKGADLVVFPELFLTGYPPKDLLEKADFIEEIDHATSKLIALSKKYSHMGILIGMPTPAGKDTGKRRYNSAVLFSEGKVLGVQSKFLLPTYDVFDETRYFDSAPEVKAISFKDEKLGISICEDMWNISKGHPEGPYELNPIEKLIRDGATLLINLSASPFYAGKDKIRYDVIQEHVKEYAVPFLFCNQIGGNDELIFDGKSFCVDAKGEAIAVLPAFKEHVETVDTAAKGTVGLYAPEEEIASIHDALVLGVKDYMGKCGFTSAVIGLSGGIDSAVTCALAKEAIGSDKVLGISMPSFYSAKESEEYSRTLSENLSTKLKVVPIQEVYASYIGALKGELSIDESEEVGVYLQNIQARVRGNVLMGFSNKQGSLVLTTGNKSELAVGYCTLYGDMAGGLAVISDVPKTMVYKLADYINREKEMIPKEIIDRPPTAELKPNQLDQDTLPPYNTLDEILYYYLEEGYSSKKLIEKGFKSDTVDWVISSVNKNEYKRRQVPPGIKVTSKAFGVGRRMPIAMKIQ